MKLKEYIKKLKEYENEGFGELEVIYSKDDEGNEYHIIDSNPIFLLIGNLNDYYLDVEHVKDDKLANCICIN